MKIYVGNLSYETTEDELSAEFGTFGKVDSVAIPQINSAGGPGVLPLWKWARKPRQKQPLPGLTASR